MKWILRKCVNCRKYTLNHIKCPYCGSQVITPHPPRFSPEDKYVEHRLRMKMETGQIDLSKKPLYVID